MVPEPPEDVLVDASVCVTVQVYWRIFVLYIIHIHYCIKMNFIMTAVDRERWRGREREREREREIEIDR